MNKQRFIWGLIFLGAGLLLLLFRLDILEWNWTHFWPFIIVLVSVAMHVDFFLSYRRNVGILFPAGVLLVYGGLFVAVNTFGVLKMDMAWPIFILGPAFGFWELFLLRPSYQSDISGGVLVPALILTFVGGGLLLRNYYDFDWYLMLPITIMTVGVVMLLYSYRKKKRITVTTPVDPPITPETPNNPEP